MNNQLYFEDVKIGTELPILEKTPTTQQLVMYAGASGDFYQIHYDQDFARDNGLPNVIIHGALKNAFLGQLLTDWIGQRGSIKKLAVEYRGMDMPGSKVYCRGLVTSKKIEDEIGIVECEIWLEDASGKKTTPGKAVVALPLR